MMLNILILCSVYFSVNHRPSWKSLCREFGHDHHRHAPNLYSGGWGFQKKIATFKPWYIILSRSHMMKMIEKKHDETKLRSPQTFGTTIATEAYSISV